MKTLYPAFCSAVIVSALSTLVVGLFLSSVLLCYRVLCLSCLSSIQVRGLTWRAKTELYSSEGFQEKLILRRRLLRKALSWSDTRTLSPLLSKKHGKVAALTFKRIDGIGSVDWSQVNKWHDSTAVLVIEWSPRTWSSTEKSRLLSSLSFQWFSPHSLSIRVEKKRSLSALLL